MEFAKQTVHMSSNMRYHLEFGFSCTLQKTQWYCSSCISLWVYSSADAVDSNYQVARIRSQSISVAQLTISSFRGRLSTARCWKRSDVLVIYRCLAEDKSSWAEHDNPVVRLVLIPAVFRLRSLFLGRILTHLWLREKIDFRVVYEQLTRYACWSFWRLD